MNVLHVMSSVDVGGISMVVLNYYKNLQNENVKFDIAITSDIVGQTGKQFEKLGAEIYIDIPQKSRDLKGYKKSLEKILSSKKYDAIHVHENETSYVALSIAKKMGIQKRIAHSHTSSPYISLRSELRRISGIILNNYYSTKLISCSKESAFRVFGNSQSTLNKLTILPNAINTSKFIYNSAIRKEYQKKFRLENKFVVGTVGRLDVEKNHKHLLKVFAELLNYCSNSILIIVGEGPLKEELQNIVEIENLQENVLLLGARDDVNCIMQALDVFVLPSIHEAFPVVISEAVIAGLPIVLSQNITEEVKIGDDMIFLSLDESKVKWVEYILNYNNDTEREKRSNNALHKSIDIKDASKLLKALYTD